MNTLDKTLRKLNTLLEKWSILYIFMAVVGLFRFAIMSNLAVVIYPDAGYDDVLMCRLAENIYYGQWLGDYNYLTLVKAWFFSYFVAGCHTLGISYLDAQIILQTLGVAVFCRALCGLFGEKKKSIYLIYTLLLFCPIMHASWTFQRLYRGGLPAICEYFVLAGFIAVYASDKDYKGLLRDTKINWFSWMCIAGAGFTAMWLTKEDSIWIVPFIVVAAVLAVCKWAKANDIWTLIKSNRKIIGQIALRVAVLCIPFVMLLGTTAVIKHENKAHYGLAVVTDTSGTQFARVIKLMYSVADDHEQDYVSVSWDKLQKLYTVSPTLALAQGEINQAYIEGDTCDRQVGDGQLEDGWFYWYLRLGVSRAGYYVDANTSEQFYQQVADEIESAIDDGKLETRATMPSTLMSPWRKGYTGKLLSTMWQANRYVISYDDIETSGPIYDDAWSSYDVKRMGDLTGNVVLDSSEQLVEVKGWIIWKGQEDVSIELTSDGGLSRQLEWQSSQDVAASQYAELNPTMAANCRFEGTLTITKDEDVKLSILDAKGTELLQIPLSDGMPNYEDDNCFLSLDHTLIVDEQQYIIDAQTRYANRMNKITRVYQMIGALAFWIAIAGFLYIVLRAVVSKIDRLGNIAWVALGLLLSYVLILGGISYTEISAYEAIRYMYLVSAYPLVIGFETIVIFTLIGDLYGAIASGVSVCRKTK